MASRLAAWLLSLSLGLAGGSAAARADAAPDVIKIGTLYASSGLYASVSMPVYSGFKLWVDQMNAEGGVMVKAFGKKIPLKLIAYDDQSNPGTAATLTNQLITQDKVDILLSDSGSVLTAPAVAIAREHKQLLFDVTGTGAAFFTPDNPYIALMADPVSSIWPHYISDFLDDVGVKAGIKSVAILFATNDFTGTQANALKGFFEKSGKLKIVYFQGVPTNTSNYSTLITNIAAAKPDAVIELGFTGNDIAFLRGLQDSGEQFRFVFTVYAGLEHEEVLHSVGPEGLTDMFSYVPPAMYDYKPNFGMDLTAFHAAWDKVYPPGGKVSFGANAVYGYTSALVVQRALETAASLSQDDLRKAVFALSGQLKTLDGAFELRADGAQTGEVTPLGQLQPDAKSGLKMVVVYPPEYANGQAILGK